jgi:fluoride exporter
VNDGTRDPLPFDADVEEDASGAQRKDRFSPLVFAAIALGGALGAPARYGVAQLVHSPGTGFPWATFWTNVSGSFALGVVLVCVIEKYPPTRYVRPFVATGFLGAYTTFSTFAVDGDLLVRAGQAPVAIVYWIVSVAACVAAAFAGMVGTRRWWRTA